LRKDDRCTIRKKRGEEKKSGQGRKKREGDNRKTPGLTGGPYFSRLCLLLMKENHEA